MYLNHILRHNINRLRKNLPSDININKILYLLGKMINPYRTERFQNLEELITEIDNIEASI